MLYKYITENNLYNKQTYMYSEYGGTAFLREYLISRQKYLDMYEELQNVLPEYEERPAPLSEVAQDLLCIKQVLEVDKPNCEVINLVNAYTKSFEVRKRIYNKYDGSWKPIQDMGFEDYTTYLIFAECLMLTYENTKCLKYLNCMLKVNDTLLSVQDMLDNRLKFRLYQVIKRELDFIDRLAIGNGVNLEE